MTLRKWMYFSAVCAVLGWSGFAAMLITGLVTGNSGIVGGSFGVFGGAFGATIGTFSMRSKCQQSGA